MKVYSDISQNFKKLFTILLILNIQNYGKDNSYLKNYEAIRSQLCNFESNTENENSTSTCKFKKVNKTVNETPQETKEIREWAIDVYIAADNDLHYFAWNNIKQLANGANKNLYIIVQLNEPGRNKKTQRYLIEKNKAILLNKENQQKLDSGDPQTLIDFSLWSIKNFPAKKRMLILSNHGSGVIDRSVSRLINPTEFFVLNPSNLMLELDRSIEFLKSLERSRNENDEDDNGIKGLCYDETYQTYFTNQKLEYALRTICNEAAKFLNQKEFKFSIFGMDACLMQMIEVANILKSFAQIAVASTEVELGPGWKYDKILRLFEQGAPDEISFAKHIVKVYEETYSSITNDFTLSAIDLNKLDNLEKNINSVSEILIDMLQNQKNDTVHLMIKKCKANIAFEEPSYIDIASFYNNIITNLDTSILKDHKEHLKGSLLQTLNDGLKIIQSIVIENVSGTNIKYSKGLSIYFPDKRIHNSYRQTNFAQSNQWTNLLSHYISL